MESQSLVSFGYIKAVDVRLTIELVTTFNVSAPEIHLGTPLLQANEHNPPAMREHSNIILICLKKTQI